MASWYSSTYLLEVTLRFRLRDCAKAAELREQGVQLVDLGLEGALRGDLQLLLLLLLLELALRFLRGAQQSVLDLLFLLERTALR